MIMDMLKGILAVKLALLLPEYADNEVNLQNLRRGWDWRELSVISSLFGLISEGEERGSHFIRTRVGHITLDGIKLCWHFHRSVIPHPFVSLGSILASIAFPVFILVIFNVDNPPQNILQSLLPIGSAYASKNIGRLLKVVRAKFYLQAPGQAPPPEHAELIFSPLDDLSLKIVFVLNNLVQSLNVIEKKQ